MFFFFPPTYQGPEIRAVFHALRDDFLEEVDMCAVSLSWSEEGYNHALEELLPCMVDLANRKYAAEQAMRVIRSYALCGKFNLCPLKLCLLYILFGGLDGEDYFDYIKCLFHDIIESLNFSMNYNIFFDINKLKKYSMSEENFFKVNGSEYNDLYNKYKVLQKQHDANVKENHSLTSQIKQKQEELTAQKSHAYISTLVDYIEESDAKPEVKEMLSHILSGMFIKTQNEEVKEAYERLKDSISADKKNARGGNTFISVAPGGMNIGNIGRVDNLGPQS